MSHQYVLPSSLRLELEAQRMYATARVPRLGETAPALVLRRFPQMFDAFAWAAAVILVFPHRLFPGLGLQAGALAGLSLWGLAYAVQPLGRWVFSAVRGRHGRGVGLTAARFLLGAFTVAVALPPVSPGASAVVLLAGCRLFQGLAMGGLSSPALAEGAATRIIAGVLGLIAAGGLFAVLQAVLGPKDFLDWGWRYPFILGVPVNTVALFADLRLLATDGGERSGARPRLATVSGESLQ